MSLTNWLLIFVLCIFSSQANWLYGIIALVGFMFAHMGTNVFDDVIDQWLKVPKQKYKSTHLDNGQTNVKTILKLAIFYFIVAGLIGAFFVIKCGFTVAIIAFIGAVIALLYPRLNNFALGELAVGLTFGPLFFAGINFVMLEKIELNNILISFPVAIFTVIVLMVHALMDYDFDIKSGKKTLIILMGSKKAGLNLIIILMLFAYLFTIILVCTKSLPLLSLLTLVTSFGLIPLYKKLDFYINSTEHKEDEFIKNFGVARNIGTAYCLILAVSLILNNLL